MGTYSEVSASISTPAIAAVDWGSSDPRLVRTALALISIALLASATLILWMATLGPTTLSDQESWDIARASNASVSPRGPATPAAQLPDPAGSAARDAPSSAKHSVDVLEQRLRLASDGLARAQAANQAQSRARALQRQQLATKQAKLKRISSVLAACQGSADPLCGVPSAGEGSAK